MDNLARNAMLARQAGLSYGKWKALQPVVPIVKVETIPDDWVRCAYCDKPFKPFDARHKYCSYECRRQAYDEKRSEMRKNARLSGK